MRARDDIRDFGLILVSGRRCHRKGRHVGGCGEGVGVWVGEEEKDVCKDGGKVVRKKAEENSRVCCNNVVIAYISRTTLLSSSYFKILAKMATFPKWNIKYF